MAEIVQIKKDDKVVYPITIPEAIVDKNGITLEQKLSDKATKEDVNAAISNAITVTLNTPV
jgi:hypothetical protein